MSWLIARILCVIYTIQAIDNRQPSCTLPPDFWCDHPSVTVACTGSSKYCDQYRRSRMGKLTQVRLAFESACPDSQRFIVDRMYPKVFSNLYISELVDFKAYPYGLARRETVDQISCHHGQRECIGNRLLTCMMNQYADDQRSKNKIFSCFMSLMFNKQQDPEVAIQACMRKIGAPMSDIQTVVACSKSQKASVLQRVDEIETRKILRQPRFVPFIEINGYSHINMQAYQMIMPEKLHAWNTSLQRMALSTDKAVLAESCQLPPDFWCLDSTTINQCFESAGCQHYQNAIYGQPLRIKVIYSDSPASRNYVLGYIKQMFFLNSPENKKLVQDKVVIELEPSANASSPCGKTTCQYQAVQQCVASKVEDAQTRNQMLLCLLETGGDMLANWNQRCYTFKPQFKDAVAKCASSDEWKREVVRRAEAQSSLYPEPKRSVPWIVLNGYSLPSVQQFSNILHRFICLWYRGPNHKRENCFRCEYELTHCAGR